MVRVQLRVERDPDALLHLLPQIRLLADAEKDSLGFLPVKAFEEAIVRRRLIAALVLDGGRQTFAGYLLHSGVFPYAKVQQIAAIGSVRKTGVASALLKAFISDLERIGFISIQADVAADLPNALRFYLKNGFERVLERRGGISRGRTIYVHSRLLETDNLFNIPEVNSTNNLDFVFRHHATADVPIYAFDLNVYFDLVRQRSHSASARLLFGQALGHTIRLAVADEFVLELQKTSKEALDDPVLQMALRLPRLPKADSSTLQALADRIYEVVFVKTQARGVGTPQGKSDAYHVAHAALSRAAAFITRDGPILKARNELLEDFGIDIVTVEEVLNLFPSESINPNLMLLEGEGFSSGSIDPLQLLNYLSESKVSADVIREFEVARSSSLYCKAIWCDGHPVGVGAAILPKSINPVVRMLVHVRPESQEAELFSEHLLEHLIGVLCRDAPIAMELMRLPGQSIVNNLASTRGFYRSSNLHHFYKIAVGRPLTDINWSTTAALIRRRTGLTLPNKMPTRPNDQILINYTGEINKSVSAVYLEEVLSPAVIVWPAMSGVIVPIARNYADELLGTSLQSRFSFIHNYDAAFLSIRGYVNSPRTAKQMRPGSPIIFYESKRSRNGRGAAIAVARIVNSIVAPKSELGPSLNKRLVVDNIDGFSSSDFVLLTTFDNLMSFPHPVGFGVLKNLKAVGGASMVSAVSLSSEQIAIILGRGWSGENPR